MGEVSTIGLDLAKTVFQAHGANASGEVVFRKKLRRDALLAFFASQPPCLVAMEACASAHYWAREIAVLGHETRLIPPAYVKPFVKRQKNDMADAEASLTRSHPRSLASRAQLKSARSRILPAVFSCLANSPHVLRLERGLGPDDPPRVPGPLWHSE